MTRGNAKRTARKSPGSDDPHLPLAVILERLESRTMLAGDAANAAPTIDAIAGITIEEDAPLQTVVLDGISAGGGETQALRVTARSSNRNVVPDPTVTYSSPKAFGTLTFVPVANAAGVTTMTVEVEDAGADGDLATAADNAKTSRTFVVTVRPINDPPVLDSSASPSLGSVEKNAGPPAGAVGVPVTMLVDAGGPLDNVRDVDGDSVGIAITTVNLEGGKLWYSVDGGTTWLGAAAVSEQSPLLLSADAANRLFFQPAASWSGAIADVITFRAWDGNQRWTQVGGDIDGEAAQDNAGSAVSVSADGTTLAVGAKWNDGNGNGAGHVRVYRWNAESSGWRQFGADIDGEAALDNSGASVSLSADGMAIAIGATGNDAAGLNAGHVRIYAWDLSTAAWRQRGADIDGAAAFDGFGTSVSLSADGMTVAVGAPGHDRNANGAGHVLVYRWDGGTSTWVQRGAAIEGRGEFDGMGTAVALSSDGSILAVGAPGSQGRTGEIRVYRWDVPSFAWTQMGVNLRGEAGADNFGASVSLSGDGMVVAAGAPGNDATGFGAGHARVFRWNAGSSSWAQLGSDIDGEAAFDGAGSAVALSADGRTIAITATGNDGNGNNAGHTRVYRWQSAAANWTQVFEDIDGEAAGDGSGSSVAVSADGETVVIGALGNGGNGSQSGQVRVYRPGPVTSVAQDAVSVDVVDVDVPVNAQPTLDAIANVAMSTSVTQTTVGFTGVTAGGGESQPLRVTATSSNPSVIPHPVVTYSSPDSSGSLTFTRLLDELGGVTITVTVEDGGLDGDLATGDDNQTSVRTFEVRVVEPFESLMTFTSNGLWVLNRSNGGGFEQSTFAVWRTNETTWDAVLEGDFNGDGLTDVAGRTGIGQWWASINQGDGTAAAPQFMIYWKSSLDITSYVSGDFNGDGRTDVAGLAANGAVWAGLAKSDSIGFTNTRIGTLPVGTLANPITYGSLQAGDFNGDGRTDVAALASNGRWNGLASEPGGRWSNQVLGFWDPALAFTADVLTGDFDGNGRTDIAGRTEGGSWWAAMANTDSVGFTNTLLGSWDAAAGWRHVSVGDFNGDGRSDIAGMTAGGQWWGLVSDGTEGFRNSTQLGSWNANATWTAVTVGDADGDGRDEIIGRVAVTPESARGALWVSDIVDDGPMQTARWGLQGVVASVEARNIFFSRF